MMESTLGVRARLLVLIFGTVALSGCVAMNQHVTGMLDTVTIKAKQQRDLAEIRSDTRERLADELDVVRKAEAEKQIEQARLDANQRRLEMELCIARQQQQQQQVENNLKQKLQSKIAFNAEHGLEVGELEVDTEALKTLLENREKEPPPKQQEQNEPKKPCSCCDKPCGCRPGLIRRLCPKCCRKPCEAEKNCGGPATFAQMQQQQQKQPLRPAEIPMKLPVRLTFGLQQPQLEGAKITIEPPIQQPQLGEEKCCPRCDMPGDRCACPDSCVDRAPGTQGRMAPPDILEQPVATPPAPEPDLDSSAVHSPKPTRSNATPASSPAVAKRKSSTSKSSTKAAPKPAVLTSRVSDAD